MPIDPKINSSLAKSDLATSKGPISYLRREGLWNWGKDEWWNFKEKKHRQITDSP